MIPLTKKQHINAFVDTPLPSKRQIFARTGQVAVNPSGMYSGDIPVSLGQSTTQNMEHFVREVELQAAMTKRQTVDSHDTPNKVVQDHHEEMNQKSE